MKSNSHFFNKIASKVLPNCIHKINDFILNKKVTAGATVCAVALLAGVAFADDSRLNQIETVYHVYVDGNHIGSVDSENIINQLVSQKINDIDEEYENLNLVISEQLEIIPEKVFQVRAKNKETITQLEDQLSVKAEAIALTIGGQVVGFVSSEKEAEEVIYQLKEEFVSKEVIERLEMNVDRNEEITLPNVGETIISDVRLSEKITLKEDVAKVNEVLSVKEAVKKLTLGTLEDKIHIVEPGDVLGTIAQKYQLSTSEVLEINPDITEDTLLQIGDEINVTDYEPYVYVVVEETTTVDEEIPFQTETKESDSMWKGDTKIEQQGISGERIVSYAVIKENGRIIKRNIIEEKVTKEPINRIVVKGTKKSPSRGTGNFSWPAVGGYISSYQGMRWGRFHKGIDIARPANRNILSADNGKVSFAGYDGGYGNKVIVNHNNGYETLYAHLASIDVKVGQTVGAGQKIGTMGSTGSSTGVHLHFEVYKNGKLQNPMDYINK